MGSGLGGGRGSLVPFIMTSRAFWGPEQKLQQTFRTRGRSEFYSSKQLGLVPKSTVGINLGLGMWAKPSRPQGACVVKEGVTGVRRELGKQGRR